MNILDLPDWDVLQRDEAKGEYVIRAQPRNKPEYCPGCGVVDAPLYRFGTRPIEIRDLPMHGKKVVIKAARRRYRCKECEHTFSERLPNVDENHRATERLVEFVAVQSLGRTFTSIAEEVGVSEFTVRRIFAAHIAALNEAWEENVETPRVLGIDELMIAGSLRCILTNVEQRSAVDLLEKRDMLSVEARLRRFDPSKVAVVTMDMWRPYRDASRRAFPGAAIVVDKFHVERLATYGLDLVRKRIKGDMTDRQRRQLKRDRMLLLNRPFNLSASDKVILDSWVHSYPDLWAAYDLKERFHAIYSNHFRNSAERSLDAWLDSIPQEMAGAFGPLKTAVKNWRKEILAYFDHRVTNAYTESLNGLAKMANRQGRGYSFDAIRAKLLFHIGVNRGAPAGSSGRGYHAPPPTDMALLIAEHKEAYAETLGPPFAWHSHEPGRFAGADMFAFSEVIQNSLDAVIGGDFSTDEDRDGDDEK